MRREQRQHYPIPCDLKLARQSLPYQPFPPAQTGLQLPPNSLECRNLFRISRLPPAKRYVTESLQQAVRNLTEPELALYSCMA